MPSAAVPRIGSSWQSCPPAAVASLPSERSAAPASTACLTCSGADCLLSRLQARQASEESPRAGVVDERRAAALDQHEVSLLPLPIDRAATQTIDFGAPSEGGGDASAVGGAIVSHKGPVMHHGGSEQTTVVHCCQDHGGP
jgi:hypothetical protein